MLPRWVGAADLLTLLALVVAVAVVVGGGFRVRFGPIRLAATSPVMPWVVVLLLAGFRHARHRRPSLPARAVDAAARLTRWEPFRAVWGPFVATRTAVAAVGLLALVTIGYAPGEPNTRLFDHEVMNLPVRWDAGWYFQIAKSGYYWDRRQDRQQNIAFFPAFPMATRAVARLFGGEPEAYLIAGVALSHAAFLAALLLLYQLARSLTGDDLAARSAVLLASCYPFAVFYGAYYTESFYLLGVAGALYWLERDRPWAAVLFGLLAGLTRPNGFLLAAPLALVAFRVAGARARRRSAATLLPWLAAIAAPLAGVAIYSAYIYALTGDPLTWWAQHAAWGRTFEGAEPIVETAGSIGRDGLLGYLNAQPYRVINAIPAAAAIALAVPVWRRFGAAYGLFVLLNVVPPLIFGGTISMGRVTATMFPLFVWLAVAFPRWTGPLAGMFAILQGLAAALFYTWRPLY
jgi:Gpi18-like mannosyltransferase